MEENFAYEVPSLTNGIEKDGFNLFYEQYQFDWAKRTYLLEGSLESVQTDLGTGLIVYNSQNTIQIGDTVSLNTQTDKVKKSKIVECCPTVRFIKVPPERCAQVHHFSRGYD